MSRVWGGLGSAVAAAGRLVRRPLALTVFAVVLAVLGASTIAYAVTRPDPNRPPVAAGAQDSSAGVPVPVLPAAAPAQPVTPPPAQPSARVPPALPTAPVVPLLPTVAPAAPRATGRPSDAPKPAATRPAARTPAPRRSTPAKAPVRTLPNPLGTSAPVRVVVRRLKIDRKPISLGVTKANALEVPDDAEDLGWYTGGPTPGAMGSAVIAGHVSYNEPGVFYRLATLERGDTVQVTRKDGTTAVFTVSGTRTYPKDEFPTADVYGFVDRAALRLITCGGDYDEKTRHFADNVVVYADMTSVIAKK